MNLFSFNMLTPTHTSPNIGSIPVFFELYHAFTARAFRVPFSGSRYYPTLLTMFILQNRFTENEEKYRRIALDMLSKKINNGGLDETDLFATYFLVLRSKWHSLSSLKRYENCIRIYRFLEHRPPARTSLFTVYGPFILDEFTTWLNTERVLQLAVCSSISQEVHIEWPSFSLFRQHISPFSNEKWPSFHLACVLLLWYYLRLLASSIVRVVDRHCCADSQKDQVPESLVDAVKCQFYDPNLQTFLAAAESSSGQGIWEHKVEEVAPSLLITSWSICIRIVIRIMEDQDLLHALLSEEVHSCASKLVMYLRAYPHQHATTVSLVLAGLGLQQEYLCERKPNNSWPSN